MSIRYKAAANRPALAGAPANLQQPRAPCPRPGLAFDMAVLPSTDMGVSTDAALAGFVADVLQRTHSSRPRDWGGRRVWRGRSRLRQETAVTARRDTETSLRFLAMGDVGDPVTKDYTAFPEMTNPSGFTV